jgi:branched-chain amino acid transport system ATP-binding protein
MPILELESVDAFYEQSHVLHEVSIAVEEEAIVSLLGRNGAGKTTTLRSIMGLVEVDGAITFKGTDITALSTFRIARQGISMIPEERRLYPDHTVAENLRIGEIASRSDEEADRRDRISEVYDYFPKLQERQGQDAGQLSGGEQQMLTLARALVTAPDVILIDEPTEGLMPTLVTKLGGILEEINTKEQITILLVEQNVELALDISDYAYIIDKGEIQFDGPSRQVRKNPEVVEKYITLSGVG